MDDSTKPVFETDDKNLAALLRALGMTQVGRRAEESPYSDRPHYHFQFDNAELCERHREAALLGTITVNYRRLIAEQGAVLDQIFQHKRRNFPSDGGELPPFMRR